MIKNYIFTISLSIFIINCTNTTEKETSPKPLNTLEYKCENGQKLHIIYLPIKNGTPYIQIEFEDIKYDLKHIHSASGEKYSNGKQTWWSKNASGFFQVDDVITMKNCNAKVIK